MLWVRGVVKDYNENAGNYEKEYNFSLSKEPMWLS